MGLLESKPIAFAFGLVAEIAAQLTESAVERLSGIKANTADVNNAVQQVARG